MLASLRGRDGDRINAVLAAAESGGACRRRYRRIPSPGGEASTRWVRLAAWAARSRTACVQIAALSNAEFHIESDEGARIGPVDHLIGDQVFVRDQVFLAVAAAYRRAAR